MRFSTYLKIYIYLYGKNMVTLIFSIIFWVFPAMNKYLVINNYFIKIEYSFRKLNMILWNGNSIILCSLSYRILESKWILKIMEFTLFTYLSISSVQERWWNKLNLEEENTVSIYYVQTQSSLCIFRSWFQDPHRYQDPRMLMSLI